MSVPHRPRPDWLQANMASPDRWDSLVRLVDKLKLPAAVREHVAELGRRAADHDDVKAQRRKLR